MLTHCDLGVVSNEVVLQVSGRRELKTTPVPALSGFKGRAAVFKTTQARDRNGFKFPAAGDL